MCMNVYMSACMCKHVVCMHVCMCVGVWFSMSGLLTYNNDSEISLFSFECGMFPRAHGFEYLVVPFWEVMGPLRGGA